MTDDWQPTQKQAAIISLLGVLWAHLAFVPGAAKPQRYGESEVREAEKGYRPAPVWQTLDCDGRCLWADERYPCEWHKQCKGEWWQVVRERLRRRYRIEAVAVSLDKLLVALPAAWRAVVALYVDPYDPASEPLDEWHRKRRQDWARKGIEFMEREIPGEVLPFGEDGDVKRLHIRNMLEAGYTYKRIAREAQVSKREISAVKREMLLFGSDVRSQSTVSAEG